MYQNWLSDFEHVNKVFWNIVQEWACKYLIKHKLCVYKYILNALESEHIIFKNFQKHDMLICEVQLCHHLTDAWHQRFIQNYK